jgi:hypothetical protein
MGAVTTRRAFAVLVVALTLSLPEGARGGGSPIGFVSLPAEGTLAAIALPGGGTLARIAVPGAPRSVAASMNGRRVLVASPDAGTVTEIDGVSRRVVRIFHGFERPVAVALDFAPPVGIVTPRYAYVLDETAGTLDVLDLARGQIARRLEVGAHPERIAVDAAELWIAHAGSGALTRVSVSSPTKPRLLASVDAGAPVAALAADPQLHSVFVSTGAGIVARFVDGSVRGQQNYRRLIGHEPIAGLALAVPDLLVAVDRRGLGHVLREQTGKPVSRLRVPTGVEAADVYGGWLVATLPRALALVAVPDGSMPTSVGLGARIGGFAWAVL